MFGPPGRVVGEVAELLHVRMCRCVHEHGPRWTFAVLRLGELGDDDLQALVVAQAQDVAEVLQPLGADGRGDVERACRRPPLPCGFGL